MGLVMVFPMYSINQFVYLCISMYSLNYYSFIVIPDIYLGHVLFPYTSYLKVSWVYVVFYFLLCIV